MRTNWNTFVCMVAVAIMAVSCTYHDSIVMDSIYINNVRFNISEGGSPETKSQNVNYTESDSKCYAETIHDNVLDNSTAFGIIGFGKESGSVLIDNQAVYNTDGARMAHLTVNAERDDNMLISAYYPYTGRIVYNQGGKYSVSFNSDDIQKGPMIADVYQGCRQLDEDIKLNFTSIISSIGFGVCDITRDEQLQGHIHVRQVILHGMQLEGAYIYNGMDSHWAPQRRTKSVVVYDGCDSVMTGIENSCFLTDCRISDNIGDCNRINVIPEQLSNGIQTVEVVFDVDSFEYYGTRYNGIREASQTFSLSNLVPGSVLEQGCRYTCTLGLDLGLVYRTIEFTASVSDWNDVAMK